MKIYKIHIPYLSSSGKTYMAGNYEEGTFDLSEARTKSFVTLVDVEVATESKPTDNLHTQKFNDESAELPIFEIEPEVSVNTFSTLKINSADIKDIEGLKYVSKKTAEAVIAERGVSKFSSYEDLNTRIKLKLGRKWEDITIIDFELPDNAIEVTNYNTLTFS
jgi:DNA uptake protein ComE-like DNA-binding protein